MSEDTANLLTIYESTKHSILFIVHSIQIANDKVIRPICEINKEMDKRITY